MQDKYAADSHGAVKPLNVRSAVKAGLLTDSQDKADKAYLQNFARLENLDDLPARMIGRAFHLFYPSPDTFYAYIKNFWHALANYQQPQAVAWPLQHCLICLYVV